MAALLGNAGYSVKALALEQVRNVSQEVARDSCHLFLYDLPTDRAAVEVIAHVKKASPTTFIAVWSPKAAESGLARVLVHDKGANMVTQCPHALAHVATSVARHACSGGQLECAACGMKGLTEDHLWEHYPLFHVNDKNIEAKCNVCGKHQHVLATHLHNRHGPVGRGEAHGDNHKPVELHSFALVVCQHPDGRFLLVQEFCNQGFWLPGGAVDPGESLSVAAVRETREEAGVDVELTGVLKVEHSAHNGYVRLRTIFTARPLDPTQKPKSVPDYESVGAAYVSVEDIQRLRLRGDEPLVWCNYLARGGQVFPLSLLEDRGRRSGR